MKVISTLSLTLFALSVSSLVSLHANEIENENLFQITSDKEILGHWRFDKLTCASGAKVNTAVGTYTVNFQFFPNYMQYFGTSTYSGKPCVSHYEKASYKTATDSNGYNVFQTLPQTNQTSIIVYNFCPTTNTQEDFTFIPEPLVYKITKNKMKIIRNPVLKPNRFCKVGDSVIEHFVRE